MPSSCRLFAGISAPDEPMAWTGTVLPCVAYLLVFFFVFTVLSLHRAPMARSR